MVEPVSAKEQFRFLQFMQMSCIYNGEKELKEQNMNKHLNNQQRMSVDVITVAKFKRDGMFYEPPVQTLQPHAVGTW